MWRGVEVVNYVSIITSQSHNELHTVPYLPLPLQVIPGRMGNKLFIFYTEEEEEEEEEGGKRTKLHVFQSDRTPVGG